MKKRFLALLLSAVTVVSMTGCSLTNEAANLVTLGDYEGLEVELDASYEVTNENVKTMVETYFLDAVPNYSVDKEKTTVADGDVVNINYKGMLDGEAFDGGTAENYNLVIGSGTFIDGFEAGLVGKDVGSTVELELTFPEDYSSEELAGKETVFEVTINSIMKEKKMTYKTMTDEYVEANFKDYYGVSTAKELKQYVKDYLKSSHDQAVTSMLQAELLEICEVDEIPNELLTERTEEYRALSTLSGMTEEEFDEQINEQVKDSLPADLVWEAIAAKEGIRANGEGYEEFKQNIMSMMGFEDEEAMFEAMPESLLERMYCIDEARKVVLETAKITYVKSEVQEDVAEETTEEVETTEADAADSEEAAETDDAKAEEDAE